MFREASEYSQSHSGKKLRHSTSDLPAARARGQCFVPVCLPPEQRWTQWTCVPSLQDFLGEASLTPLCVLHRALDRFFVW